MRSINQTDRHNWLTGFLAGFNVSNVSVVLISVLAGLVATTASPIAIGVFAGGIVGLGLFVNLEIAVWLVVVGAMFIGGMIVQFAPQLSKALWLFSMLGFLLFSGALFRCLGKPSLTKDLPWFAWLALAFPIYAVIVSLANFPDAAEFLAGFKRYFQFSGLFAALIFVPIKDSSLRKLLQFLFILGLLQVFFTAYQVLVVVPSRVGMGGGVVPMDAVSGTFESSATGGGSKSILVMFVLLVFTYVLSTWRDKLLGSRAVIVIGLLLLSPLFMGGSKIAVIFLPLVVMVVMQRDLIRNPLPGFFILLITVALTAVLSYLYLAVFAKGHDSADQTFARIVAYNLGNVGYMTLSGLNRMTVLSFWWEHQSWSDPVAFLFGHGIGSSYTADGALVSGHLGEKYLGLSIGLTGLSTLLWDTGVLGATWFTLILVGAVAACHRTVQYLPIGRLRAIGLSVEAGLLMNLLLLPYGNSMLALPSHEVILMFLLAATVLLFKRTFTPVTGPSEKKTITT